MYRIAARRAASALSKLRLPPPPSSSLRLFSSSSSNGVPLARQMANYALSLAWSQRSAESYGQAMLVLEQALGNLRREDGASDDAVGVVLLAMSTLLADRGDLSGAEEKFLEVADSTRYSLDVKVAAFEASTGLNLEMGQDVSSSKLADRCLQILGAEGVTSDRVLVRAKAIKGLVELVGGNLKAAESWFMDSGPEFNNLPNERGISAGVALSHGEFMHACGKFSLAKDFYQKALEASSEDESAKDLSSVAAANMVPREVCLGALCALGQLATHAGNFEDAEESLTKALTKAEDLFGSKHPKVGVILTCLAIMFAHKAKQERSSSLLIQEGLYRRALEVLKAPSLDSKDIPVERRDIMALARGGYAEILGVQQYRKTEGERMKKWAETMWRHPRFSLAQVLDFSEPSKPAVIDSRFSRIL